MFRGGGPGGTKHWFLVFSGPRTGTPLPDVGVVSAFLDSHRAGDSPVQLFPGEDCLLYTSDAADDM
eukprot:668072-Alexandrium_andersonii.AAC.1